MPGTMSLMRSSLPRLTAAATSPALLDSTTSKSNGKIQCQQKRTIVNRSLLRLPADYPDPWPYKELGYNRYHALFDRTQPRLNVNSKLIVVEGNYGSGYSKVAKEIADQLGFLHMPTFKIEDLLVDRYGNDFRDFYPLFPKRYRVPTLDMFYKNPRDDLTAVMQDRSFHSRFEQHLNAVAHILNTGQGVVLERSPYSDFVFANALRSADYIGPEYFKHYYYVRKLALPHLRFWPHLVVYIDAPVDKCVENIKKRANVDETAVLNPQFLDVIRRSYRDSIREYQKHSKILSYDWSKPGDTDTIVEDIERIDFDFFEWHSGEVFEEWFTIVDEVGWAGWRQWVTDKMLPLSKAFVGIRKHEVSELYINPRDQGHFLNVLKNEVLKSRFGHGYNKELGDDPHAGADIYQPIQHLPEPWFDYYYREAYLHHMLPHEAVFDPEGKHSYDPLYLHAHH